MFRFRYYLIRIIVIICLVLLLITSFTYSRRTKQQHKNRIYGKHRTSTQADSFTKTICMRIDNTLRARHKTCFLRPDTGPCRADILQWYFDVKQGKCYRFFWGGCQGNGNRFENKDLCLSHCYINRTLAVGHIPYFCSLSFDYGTCFGHYNRWSWDKFSGTCRRRLYSGCGGNQNNFETRQECVATCLNAPNNTMNSFQQFTTCVPFHIAELQ